MHSRISTLAALVGYMRRYPAHEAGAVTTDWAALVAAAALLGTAAVYGAVTAGVTLETGDIDYTLESILPEIE